MMGIHVETRPDGCRVTEVYPDTPAVAAGIRAGDQIVKIDDQPVRRLEDIYQRLGSLDPGQQVALQLRRGSETAGATISLIPRTP
jgi:S1-C subfamily serine protease